MNSTENPVQIHGNPSEVHEFRRESMRCLSAPQRTEAELHKKKEGTEGNAQDLHKKKNKDTERSAPREDKEDKGG